MNIIKKNWLSLLVIGVLLIVLAGAIYLVGQQVIFKKRAFDRNLSVTLKPTSQKINLGGEASVTVKIDAPAGFGVSGIDLYVNFDKTVLQLNPDKIEPPANYEIIKKGPTDTGYRLVAVKRVKREQLLTSLKFVLTFKGLKETDDRGTTVDIGHKRSSGVGVNTSGDFLLKEFGFNLVDKVTIKVGAGAAPTTTLTPSPGAPTVPPAGEAGVSCNFSDNFDAATLNNSLWRVDTEKSGDAVLDVVQKNGTIVTTIAKPNAAARARLKSQSICTGSFEASVDFSDFGEECWGDSCISDQRNNTMAMLIYEGPYKDSTGATKVVSVGIAAKKNPGGSYTVSPFIEGLTTSARGSISIATNSGSLKISKTPVNISFYYKAPNSTNWTQIGNTVPVSFNINGFIGFGVAAWELWKGVVNPNAPCSAANPCDSGLNHRSVWATWDNFQIRTTAAAGLSLSNVCPAADILVDSLKGATIDLDKWKEEKRLTSPASGGATITQTRRGVKTEILTPQAAANAFLATNHYLSGDLDISIDTSAFQSECKATTCAPSYGMAILGIKNPATNDYAIIQLQRIVGESNNKITTYIRIEGQEQRAAGWTSIGNTNAVALRIVRIGGGLIFAYKLPKSNWQQLGEAVPVFASQVIPYFGVASWKTVECTGSWLNLPSTTPHPTETLSCSNPLPNVSAVFSDFKARGARLCAPGEQPPSVTPGPTSTPAPGEANLQLKLAFQGIDRQRDDQVVKIRIKGPPGSGIDLWFNDINATSNSSGVYLTEEINLAGVSLGSNYTIFVKGPRHLARRFCQDNQTSRCTGQGQITLQRGLNLFDFSGLHLEAGDLPDPAQGWQQDGVVNGHDLSLILERINSSDPDDLRVADIDLNGIVQTRDLSLLISTLGSKYDEDQ